MNPDVKTVAVMFDPALIPDAGDRARILAVSPLIREMMIYALRWPIDRADGDAVSDGFFRTLANLVSEALDHEAPLSLPTSERSDRGGRDGLHQGAPRLGDRRRRSAGRSRCRSAHCAGNSRHASGCRGALIFCTPGCCGRWRCWPRRASPVQETATAVGFDSLSSFTRAFAQFCGETPSSYRRRVGESAV